MGILSRDADVLPPPPEELPEVCEVGSVFLRLRWGMRIST